MSVPSVQFSKPEAATKVDNLEYCLRNLLAEDVSPIDEADSIEDVTRRNLNLLVTRLRGLPTMKGDSSSPAVLPSTCAFRLPRSQPIPEESSRPKTRWEKFAQEKRIVKRKRSRKVWDETIQDWAPRFGAYSVKKNEEKARAIIECKPGDDPYADPFEQISNEKAVTKAKQRYREARNQIEGISGQKLRPTGLQELLRRSQYSTASIGAHDPRAIGEKLLPRSTRRKVKAEALSYEQMQTKKSLRRMLDTSSTDVIDRQAVTESSGGVRLEAEEKESVSKRRRKQGGKLINTRGQAFTKKAKAKKRKTLKKGVGQSF